MQLPVYLDNNATTPCDARVVEAMLPYFNQAFGNAASRTHAYGWAAQEAVDIARQQVAQLIGAVPQEIVFTSGATEAANLALKGVFESYAGKGNHIITVTTEHKAVLDTTQYLEKLGAEVDRLPVKSNGLIDLQLLEQSIKPSTIVIAVMYANNETGVLQPIAEVGALAKKYGVLFFCDAVQAAGKIPVDVYKDEIDLMTLTAHKMYGPKGVGALFVRRKNPRVKIAAQQHGGGHERAMRSGTLNVPAIVGFGKAAEIARTEMTKDAARIVELRNRLETALLKIGGNTVNGDLKSRMYHVSNICFNGIDAEGLMMGLNKNIAVSSGSACTSATMQPSHVLKALGLSDEAAFGSIRFALGKFNTAQEIDYTIEQVTKTVLKLREMKREANAAQ